MVKPHFPQISFPVNHLHPFSGSSKFLCLKFSFFFPFSAFWLPALGPHTLFSTFPNLPAAAKLWPLLVQPCSHSPPQMDPLRVYKPQKNLLLTCVYQSFWSQCSLNSEGVEQLPEGAAVAPQLWSAALAANPLDFPGQKYPRNLKMKKKKMYLGYVQHSLSHMELRWSRVKNNKWLFALVVHEFMLQANKNPHVSDTLKHHHKTHPFWTKYKLFSYCHQTY